MNISNKTLRNLLRIIHLVIGGLVIAYIYSPLGNLEWFVSLVRVSIPILTITGISMWQMPLITKAFKRQTTASQA
jgi:hypothetical protein